jgi:hypothetical protein
MDIDQIQRLVLVFLVLGILSWPPFQVYLLCFLIDVPGTQSRNRKHKREFFFSATLMLCAFAYYVDSHWRVM